MDDRDKGIPPFTLKVVIGTIIGLVISIAAASGIIGGHTPGLELILLGGVIAVFAVCYLFTSGRKAASSRKEQSPARK